MILHASVQFGMPEQWYHEFTAFLTLMEDLGHKSARSKAHFVLSPEKNKKFVCFKLSKILV